tara:strand:- start:16 stop:192 length:177 start_codon:yes stop_codon:yes gene_type:complete
LAKKKEQMTFIKWQAAGKKKGTDEWFDFDSSQLLRKTWQRQVSGLPMLQQPSSSKTFF